MQQRGTNLFDSKRITGHVLLILFLCSILFSFTTFFAQHSEGDEITYLTISKYMDWNLSSYTTRLYDPVRSYPNKLFRAEIFLHPPLFPMILKAGWALDSPVVFGLLANIFTKFLISVIVYLICLQIRISGTTSLIAGAMTAMDPVIGFISTRLLTDIYLVAGIAATLFFLIRGINRSSLRCLFMAACCSCIALNSKFQAVLFLPLFLVAWSYSAFIICSRSPNQKRHLPLSIFASLAIISTLGLFHFLRLFFAYGIGGVHDLIYTIEVPLNEFVLRMGRRGFFEMAFYLLILQPWILILFAPSSVKTIFRSIKTQPAIQITLGFIVYSIFVVWVSSFQQERYWAPVFPLLVIILAFVFDSESKSKNQAPLAWKMPALVVCFCVMMLTNYTTNVITAGVATAEVIPVIFHILPFTRMQGTIFFGF